MADPTIEVVSGVVMDASEACTETHGIFAAKKGGKTYLGGRFFEQLYAAKAPFLAIDPVGHWSGLTLAADGKSPGLSIPVIGGQRADVPLDFEQAEKVAEYLVENGISAVIDVSELRREKRSEYVALFGDQVFETAKRVRRAMMVGVDELQFIAPQAGDKWARKALLWMIDHVKVGRNYGLGSLLLTQRPESVSKEVINQIECMFVGGLRGPQERKTIEGWVSHKQATAVREQLAELPKLKPGDFFLWSPSWLERFERVRSLSKWTYDSSSTPKLGAVRIAPTAKSKRDVADFVSGLEKISKKPVIATVPSSVGYAGVEFRKNAEELDRDNENLAHRLADLEREKADLYEQIERLEHRLQKTEGWLVSVRGMTVALHGEVERALGELGSGLDEPPTEVRRPAVDALVAAECKVNLVGAARKAREEGLKPAKRRSKVPRQKSEKEVRGGLGRCARGILGALCQHGEMSLGQAALIAGYAGNSPMARKSAGELRSLGLVVGTNGLMKATDEGMRHPAMAFLAPLPRGKELAVFWLERVGKCEKVILNEVLSAYPKRISMERALRSSEYGPTDPIVRKSAGRLRTLKLIDGGNDGMLASDKLV